MTKMQRRRAKDHPPDQGASSFDGPPTPPYGTLVPGHIVASIVRDPMEISWPVIREAAIAFGKAHAEAVAGRITWAEVDGYEKTLRLNVENCLQLANHR